MKMTNKTQKKKIQNKEKVNKNFLIYFFEALSMPIAKKIKE